MQYEITYLVGEKKEGKLDSVKKEIEGILKKEGAEILEMEVINQRKLSYEVQHEIRGTYITRRFELTEAEQTEEDIEKEGPISSITKKLNLYGDILRFIIVKANELPELKQKEEPKKKLAKKEESRKEKPKAPEKKETKKNGENIDKKLEEILNI